VQAVIRRDQDRRPYFSKTDKIFTQKELAEIDRGLKPKLDRSNAKPLVQRKCFENISHPVSTKKYMQPKVLENLEVVCSGDKLLMAKMRLWVNFLGKHRSTLIICTCAVAHLFWKIGSSLQLIVQTARIVY
jgi:hypothetical protein